MLRVILKEAVIILGSALLCFLILNVVVHQVHARKPLAVTGALGEDEGQTFETVSLDSNVIVEAEVTLQGEQATYFLRGSDGERIPLLSKKRDTVAGGYLVERFQFMAPKSGSVRIQLWADHDPDASLLYYFKFKRRLELDVKTRIAKSTTSDEKRVKIQAALRGLDNGIVAADDDAEVRAKIFTPDGDEEDVKLADNGQNGDLKAGDGIFTGILDEELEESGIHRVAAILVADHGEQRLLRRAETKFVVR